MNETKYVVKVNGVQLCTPMSTQALAENFISQLSDDQKPLAEVVPVTTNGQEILLG